ncbi:MAG: hypothetical protein ABWY93_18575 [Mycobacterium sp.]
MDSFDGAVATAMVLLACAATLAQVVGIWELRQPVIPDRAARRLRRGLKLCLVAGYCCGAGLLLAIVQWNLASVLGWSAAAMVNLAMILLARLSIRVYLLRARVYAGQRFSALLDEIRRNYPPRP